MLGPEYLDRLPDALCALWRQAEDDILRDIARRIAAADDLTETAAWQAQRLELLRTVQTDTVNTLAKYTKRSRTEIRRLLTEAGTTALAADDAIHRAAGKSPVPVNGSPALLNLLNAGCRQTRGSWQNLTATTAATVTGELEQRLDRAWLQVSSGAFDYNTAIRRAVDDLADGMKYVTYPTGHKDTLEVAVRRCALTGVNQTAAKLQLARMEELGCEFVEATAHEGARPTHAVWQGKIYHVGGVSELDGVRYEDFVTATGYGTGAGLCGWNCRHNFYPYWPGVSAPNHTPEKLAALNAKCVTYGGKQYTRYEISQMRRALERRVRKYQRRFLAEQAAGLDAGQSAAKLTAARKALAGFIRDTGGKPDEGRTGVLKKSYTNQSGSVILDTSNKIGVNPDVNYICDLNPEIYKNAVSTITTRHVIITDKQLDHIRERHPDISATVMEQLTEIIHVPDYIIETDMPYTANILKRLEINGKGYQLVLRIRTDSDPEDFQNSVITFMSVNEKRYR